MPIDRLTRAPAPSACSMARTTFATARWVDISVTMRGCWGIGKWLLSGIASEDEDDGGFCVDAAAADIVSFNAVPVVVLLKNVM